MRKKLFTQILQTQQIRKTNYYYNNYCIHKNECL